jgi:hypothetical protein
MAAFSAGLDQSIRFVEWFACLFIRFIKWFACLFKLRYFRPHRLLQNIAGLEEQCLPLTTSEESRGS